MHHGDYLDAHRGESVDNAVVALHNFSHRIIHELWHDATRARKHRDSVDGAKDPINKRIRISLGVTRDVVADGL